MKLLFKHIILICLLLYYSSFGQDETQKTILLDQVVLTGQYLPTHIDSSIYVVDVISEKELHSFGSQNLSSVLGRKIGMDVFHDQFLGSYVDFQGFSSENIKILIDDVPIPGLYNGTFDFSQISLNNIERIEIIEGPLSTIYGNNSLGATINLISKKTQQELWNISIESYLESIGQYNLAGTFNYKFRKHLLHTSFRRHYFDGWSNNENLDLFPKYYQSDSTRHQLWKPKEQFFLTTSLAYNTNNNLTIKPYLDFLDEEVVNRGYPRGAFLDYAFDEYYFTKRLRKGVIVMGPFLNRNIHIILNHHKYNRIKNKYRKDLRSLEQLPLQNDNDTTVINVFTHRITCSNLQNQKIDYQYGYEINYENLQTERVLDNIQKRTNFSFFSSFDINYNNLDIRTAFRYLYSDENEKALTPSLNLKYRIGNWSFLENIIARFSYGNGFRTPSLKEMYFNFVDVNHNIFGNPELKSEKANTLEFHMNSNVRTYNTLTFKIFFNKIQNFITLIPNENSANFEYNNIGSYKLLGLRLGSESKFNKFNVSLNLAYLGRSSVYESNLNFYPSFNSSITYNFINSKPKDAVSLFYSFKGSRSFLSKNSYGTITVEDISSYHMLDISYDTYLFNDFVTFSIGCNNILNVQNVDSETLVSGFHNNETGNTPIACGRYFFTSLKINFKK